MANPLTRGYHHLFSTEQGRLLPETSLLIYDFFLPWHATLAQNSKQRRYRGGDLFRRLFNPIGFFPCVFSLRVLIECEFAPRALASLRPPREAAGAQRLPSAFFLYPLRANGQEAKKRGMYF